MLQPRKIAQLALVAFFLAVLYLPLAKTLLGPGGAGIAQDEKRALNPLPRPGVDPVETLPDKTTAYFNDHFGFRSSLVRWYGNLKFVALRATSEDVVIGKEGWLYIKLDETLGDYTGNFLFNQRGLDKYARILDARRRYFEEQKIAHLWAVVPNKVAIHPEHLPDSVKGAAGKRRLDQLLQHLRARTRLNVVDFRQPLLRAKGPRFLYHCNDTHWNDRGVLVAYQHLCQRLGPLMPGLKPLNMDQVTFSRATHQGDLSALLGIKDQFPDVYDAAKIQGPGPREVKQAPMAALPPKDIWGRKVELHAYEGPAGKPRLLMFIDSFTTKLFQQCLARHFSRSLFILASPSLETMKVVVAEEKPDIVIEQVVERFLGLVPADYPELKKPDRS